MQVAVGYMLKGLLTQEDIADIDAQIDAIKAEKVTEEIPTDEGKEGEYVF